MRVNHIIEARVSGNRVFVKSLTHERTLEEEQDSEWEETDEAVESDEESDEESDGERKDDEQSGDPPRFNDKEMFQRVTSKPNLRSLLTTLIHKSGRASPLQNAASPEIHPRRTSYGLVDSFPSKNVLQRFPQPSIMNPPNTYPSVSSLCSSRKDMISKELTRSLRKHLLWERKEKSLTVNAVKRRHTAQKHFSQNGNSCSIHFSADLEDYHQRGW